MRAISSLKRSVFVLLAGSGLLLLSLGLTICPLPGGLIVARIGVGLSALVLLIGLQPLFHAWKNASNAKKVVVGLLAVLDLTIIGFICWVIAITIRRSS